MRATEDRNQNTILRLNRKTDINGTGMDNVLSDQPPRRRAVLRQRQRQRPKRVQRRSRLRVRELSMSQHWI